MTDGPGARFRVLSAAMRHASWALALAACALACGGEGDDPDPVPGDSACGVADQTSAGECAGLDQCGAGLQNFTKDPTCDNCPHRADSHVCEAGACRDLDNGMFLPVRFDVPPEGVGAQGLTIAAFNPIMADGSRLTCARFLSDGCLRLANPTLNATNSTHSPLPGGGAQMGMVYQTGVSAEPGPDRVVFVQVTEELSGDGAVLAWGCVDGVTVPLPADTPTLGMSLVAR